VMDQIKIREITVRHVPKLRFRQARALNPFSVVSTF
jgi:hypothetical protein